MPIIRRLAQMFVLALIAALALWAWGPAVGTRTIRVYGSSMAPTLLGEHDAWVCVDCRFPFATGADLPQAEQHPAVCPNCGLRQPQDALPIKKPGDRLWIETLSALRAQPGRFEAVVFRTPESSKRHGAQPHSIKRVAGLPGETIELRDGDVWIEGERARKKLTQQRAMAMIVHDSRYSPRTTETAPPRWAPAQERSGWQVAGDGLLTFTGTSPRRRLGSTPGHSDDQQETGRTQRWPASSSGPCDWLEYTHWVRSRNDPTRFERGEITDDYAYNRGESRRLNRVDDLLLTARVRATGAGELCFRGSIDGQSYVTQLTLPDGHVRLLRSGKPVSEHNYSAASLREGELAEESLVEFSLVDHQVLLAVGGRMLLEHHCIDQAVDMGTNMAASTQSLAIGADGLSVKLTALRVLRDVYYIPPRRLRAVTLDTEEFYVLGDNSPLSADSRTGWPGPGLAKKYLIGVLRPR